MRIGSFVALLVRAQKPFPVSLGGSITRRSQNLHYEKFLPRHQFARNPPRRSSSFVGVNPSEIPSLVHAAWGALGEISHMSRKLKIHFWVLDNLHVYTTRSTSLFRIEADRLISTHFVNVEINRPILVLQQSFLFVSNSTLDFLFDTFRDDSDCSALPSSLIVFGSVLER